MLATALIAGLVAQIEPPRGVNGSILGSVADFRTRGPARLCLEHSSFDAVRGETVYLDYLGIHWGGLRVRTSRSHYYVKEGDNWGIPRREIGRTIRGTRHRRVVRYPSPGGPRYLIYGRTDYSPDRDRPVAWVDGPALAGTDADRRILDRIDVELENFESCQRTYGYGWDGWFATRGDSR